MNELDPNEPESSTEDAAEPAGADSTTPAKLHTHALQAEKHLEALATGLASANAPKPVVSGVSRMADAMRDVIKSLNQQAADAPPPQPKPTIGSATDDLATELRANR